MEPAKKSARGNSMLVFVYSFGLLATGVGNSIYFKKMTNANPNYPFYLGQVINVVYVPIFFGLVWATKRYITREMEAFPQIKFFWMGLADGVAGLLMLFGGVHTSGSTQALLNNAVIPMTMLLATLMMGHRFLRNQYLGAATIIAGVLVVLLSSKADPSDTGDQPVFNILYLSSTLPQAFSSVYKEIALHGIEMDVNYLQAWVAWWQLLIGIAAIPVNTLSILGPNALPWSELWSSLAGGWKCMLGVDSITTMCMRDGVAIGVSGAAAAGSPALPLCDHCEGSWVPLTVYLLFNIASSVFVVLVIKHGSASLMYLISTLRLPLVQLAFTISWFNSPPDPFHVASLLGLFVTLLGLIAYRWPVKPATRPKRAPSVSLAAAPGVDNGDHHHLYDASPEQPLLGGGAASNGVNGAGKAGKAAAGAAAALADEDDEAYDSVGEPDTAPRFAGAGGSGSGQIDLTRAIRRLRPPSEIGYSPAAGMLINRTGAGAGAAGAGAQNGHGGAAGGYGRSRQQRAGELGTYGSV